LKARQYTEELLKTLLLRSEKQNYYTLATEGLPKALDAIQKGCYRSTYNMKLSKLLFWRSKGSKRHRNSSHAAHSAPACASATEESESYKEKEGTRPRSASFSGVYVDGKENIEPKSPRTKKRRSNSMGHKVKRRNSFVRLFKAARDIGKTLRQIGDDLESRHSHSSQSLSSQLR